MRIVGSLTTLPSRIGKIGDTIRSIYNQTVKFDCIYLNIPYYSVKEDSDYIIPEEYYKYCSIMRCNDYGKITKMFGPLTEELDGETIIITFDDDVIYPKELVEKLLVKSKKYPTGAIGSSGIKIGGFPYYINYINGNKITTEKQNVDILLNKNACLYKRKYFPSFEIIIRENNNLLDECDLILSGYLSAKDIPRYIFKLPIIFKNEEYKINIRKILINLYKIKSLNKGFYKNKVEYKIKDTVTFPFINFIILTIIILLFILIYRFIL